MNPHTFTAHSLTHTLRRSTTALSPRPVFRLGRNRRSEPIIAIDELTIVGLAAGFAFRSGQERLVIMGIATALCVKLTKLVRRRRADLATSHLRIETGNDATAANFQVHIVEQVRAEENLLRSHRFVPLAGYWIDHGNARILVEFLQEIDRVHSQLRRTLSFVYGRENVTSLALQRIDVDAADLGIWLRADSLFWRKCLRLRRDIMAEGGNPVDAPQLNEHTQYLRHLKEQLAARDPRLTGEPDLAAGNGRPFN